MNAYTKQVFYLMFGNIIVILMPFNFIIVEEQISFDYYSPGKSGS